MVDKWEVVGMGKANVDINDKHSFYIGKCKINFDKGFDAPEIEGKKYIVAIREIKGCKEI